MSPVMPLADSAAESASTSGLLEGPAGWAEATIAGEDGGRDGASAEGKDWVAVMVGAVTATWVGESLLNQDSTVSSALLPVMPSKATSAMELTAPQSPPYSVSPAILSTVPICS